MSWTSSGKQALIKLMYERGDKLEAIAAELRLHPRTVVRRALANGARSRPEGRPPKPAKQEAML